MPIQQKAIYKHASIYSGSLQYESVQISKLQLLHSKILTVKTYHLTKSEMKYHAY